MDMEAFTGEIYINGQPATPEQRYQIKKEMLKQAIYCASIGKFMSVIAYVTLAVSVSYIGISYGGFMKIILAIMTAIPIPFEILNALILLLIAQHKKYNLIDAAMWLAILMGIYNICLGVLGTIELSRKQKRRHLFLAFAYMFLTFSIFGVMCFDVRILNSLKKLLMNHQGNSDGNILDNNIIFTPPSNNPNVNKSPRT